MLTLHRKSPGVNPNCITTEAARGEIILSRRRVSGLGVGHSSPFEVAPAIKASGGGPSAEGDLYANHHMRPTSLLFFFSSFHVQGERLHIMTKGLVEVYQAEKN